MPTLNKEIRMSMRKYILLAFPHSRNVPRISVKPCKLAGGAESGEAEGLQYARVASSSCSYALVTACCSANLAYWTVTVSVHHLIDKRDSKIESFLSGDRPSDDGSAPARWLKIRPRSVGKESSKASRETSAVLAAIKPIHATLQDLLSQAFRFSLALCKAEQVLATLPSRRRRRDG